MKKFKVVILLMLCLALFGTIFVGCTKDDGTEKVRVCEVTHSVFYAPQYIAINKGFFKEEGIDIELSNGGGADKVMAAVLSNQIEIGFAGPEAAIYVYNEGKEDYCEVFAQMTKRDGSFLVGKDKQENFSWDSIKGKTVIPGRKGGVPYMTLEHVIKKNGIDPQKDVILDDSIQFSLMAGAFAGSNAEFVTLFEPTASAIEKEGKGYILTSIGEESGEIPYTAYFAKKSFIKENKELIEKFTKAVHKGLVWAKEHSAEEIAEVILPSFADTDLETLTGAVKSYKDIDAWNDTPVLKEEAYDMLQSVMTEAGELKEKAPYDKVVNNEFAKKVIK